MGISQEIPLTLDFQTKKKKIQKVHFLLNFHLDLEIYYLNITSFLQVLFTVL